MSACDVEALSRKTRAVVVASCALAGLALLSAAAAGLQARALDGARAMSVSLRDVTLADRAAVATSGAALALTLLSLALWSRWIRAAYTAAIALDVKALPMSAAEAAWGFLLPVVQVTRPVRALAGLLRELDGARLVAPPARAARDASGHYRDNAAASAVDAPSPPVPLGAAWALWWSGQALSFVSNFAQVRSMHDLRMARFIDVCAQLSVAIAAVFLALVVRGLDARLRQRAATLASTGEPR